MQHQKSKWMEFNSEYGFLMQIMIIISNVKYIKMILNRIYRKKIGYAF